MSTRALNRAALLSLAVVVVTLACNQPATHNPTTPSVPFVNTVEVIGPSSIAPGHAVQFFASMRLADGTVKSGSTATDVRWKSSNTSVLQVGPTGIVTPGANQGDATITADLRVGTTSRTATKEVIVQPDGTFRLVGQVTEQDAPNQQVGGARVEVVGGSSVATTDAFGNYRLYGVPAVADIRISANAYGTQTFSVQLAGNDTRNFVLPLVGPRPGFSGNYTLLIDVAGSCTGFNPPLTSDLQHRSYQAEVTQSGTALDVLLTSPQFRLNSLGLGNHFSGELINGGAKFTLGWYDSYYYPYYGPTSYPSIAEQLPNGRYLVTQGFAMTTGTPGSGLTGTMTSSGMLLWDLVFPSSNSRLLGACFSPITFKLNPR